jgi:hypothetical protein
MTEEKAVAIVEQEPKEIVIRSFDAVVQKVINEAQFQILRGRTPPGVIKTRPGKGQQTFKYVPHGYVTSVLNQAFGFDWDFETLPLANGDYYKKVEAEPEMSRKGSILVQGRLTVRIRNPQDPTEVVAEITKTATGEKEIMKGMSWGGLVKSANSDALKKSASLLGVALDLYWQDAPTDFIPASPEQIALEKAKVAALVMLDAGDKTPKQIKDEIAAEFGIEIPVKTLHKWNRERNG